MLSEIRAKESEQLYGTPVLQQSAYWSSVKEKLGTDSLAVDYTARGARENSAEPRRSDVLVTLQPVNRRQSVAYVPYGPELVPDQDVQGAFLEELSESIRSYLPKECIAIRYDLQWESWWARDESYFDENGWWNGPPDTPLQELRFNYGTVNGNFRKAASNILPSSTIFLDLHRDEEDLLRSMKPKTRYNIGLARRRGVNVRTAEIDEIETWYELYRQTAQRNRIRLHEIEYFRAILTARVRDAVSPAEVTLLIAEERNDPLAAMFLVISQNRAYYLYGASSTTRRDLMAPYAMQWSAITTARSRGCTEYDMFGVAPNPDPSHPMHGLYRFKTGFGGSIYRTLGCWDYPLDHDAYTQHAGRQIADQGYHGG